MTIRIGLVGLGTVGGGCVRILQNHHDDFLARYGVDICLQRVCAREYERAEELGVADIFTFDYHDIITDPAIDVVIELIGGTTIANDIVCGALNAGKHVVTANKALMATRGAEILQLAAQHDRQILFEASVGGGIPIIAPLQHNLVANEITSVMGIVNGTTNYMLTRMEEGLTYADALAEAQANGFAEADPTADVDGFDAAAKIAILATIAFNDDIRLGDVKTTGIRNLTPADVAAAAAKGCRIKLIASAKRDESGSVVAEVAPVELSLTHQLAGVNGVMNAIYVTGDAVGDLMFYGAGAGSGPAASAVMGDVVELCRSLERD